MTVYRPSLIALDPRQFGRGPTYALGASAAPTTSDEVRLFALTFVGGFLFMSVYLA